MPSINIDNLIDSFYSAAFDSALWPDVLQTVARITGGTSVLLFTPDPPDAKDGAWQGFRFCKEMMEAFSTHYWKEDLWQQSFNRYQERIGGRGCTYNGDALVPRRSFDASPIFNELLKTHDIGTLCGLSIPANPGMELPRVHLSIFGRPHAQPFGKPQDNILKTLAPHLRRALQLRSRLMRHASLARTTLEALDHMAAGVILLDTQDKVLYLNNAASSILARNDGITIKNDRIVAPCDINGRLKAALASLHGGAATIARSSGNPDYIVVVIPGRVAEGLFGELPTAKTLFVTDPGSSVLSQEDLLRKIWRLTPAEIRVAIALLDGLRPREISERHRVTEATVRSQIHAIFGKTGTQRQAELMRLLCLITQIHSDKHD